VSTKSRWRGETTRTTGKTTRTTGKMTRTTGKMTTRTKGETGMRRRADESPQLIPTPGNGRPPCGCDEWAQRRQVAPNDDIREGRRVHTRGHNDSHPALDETTTTHTWRLTRMQTITARERARARKVDDKGSKR